MQRTRFLWAFAVAILTVTACDETNGVNQGRLTIQLTDSPGDLKAAFIKIDKFILLRSGTDMSAANRIEIESQEPGFINLLTLTGGQVKEVVDAAAVPAGTYSELRVVVDEAYVVLQDDRVFATSSSMLPLNTTADGQLKCPSCSSSGYKVKFIGGLVITDASTIILDFDATQSFGHEAGNSGSWVMHPVLRASATTIRFGRITGSVALATGITIPACGGQPNSLTAFKPLAIMSTDSITGVTDSNGLYRIANALPGTYTLAYIPDITFTNGDSLTFNAAATPAAVTVAEADSAKANYEITAATCH